MFSCFAKRCSAVQIQTRKCSIQGHACFSLSANPSLDPNPDPNGGAGDVGVKVIVDGVVRSNRVIRVQANVERNETFIIDERDWYFRYESRRRRRSPSRRLLAARTRAVC